MKSHVFKLLGLIIISYALAGCTATGGLIIYPEPVVIGNPPPPEYRSERIYHKKSERRYSGRNHRKGYVTFAYGNKTFRVPPGHMPRRGECRIWYVHRPPGHQPPPGSCRVLRRYVPHNAVLIRG
ncbi:hypothetical protein [Rhodohalobacter mucosus]|nr:hypothetical protein [Rhodohalobacter mucosus]